MGEQGGAILTWLEKSDRFLRTGRQALTGGDYETAVSRAYYAVFHAVHALLGERQVIGSHVELIRRCVEWNRTYTRLDAAGTLGGEYRDLRRSLLGLHRWRNEADYQLQMTERLRAQRALEFAEKLSMTIREVVG